MTPEERELLTQSIKLAEENNKMLRGLRRRARISSFLRIVYWMIILGITFGAYYFIEPYVNSMVKSYNDIKSNVENVKNVTTNIPSLSDWMTKK